MDDHAVDPAQTAVLNIDMQRCFVEGSPLAPPSGLAVLDRVNGVIDACRRLGMLVVHTRMAIRADGTNTGAAMEVLVPTFIRDLYTVGSAQWELHPGLSVTSGDVVLDKPRYGAFYGTDLDLILRQRGIDTVIVTGIATNICCDATVREAAVRDYLVYLVQDATTTMAMNGITADDLQAATCASLGMVFARIVSGAELLDLASGGVSSSPSVSVPAL